jgi:hypothetical protein
MDKTTDNTAERERILRKVRACLRLAASPNHAEAAAALRQARKLMDEHGLSEADALASDVRHADATTRQRGAKPPSSLIDLVHLVAATFRCQPILRSDGGKTTIRFFGVDADAEVAAYAFVVLRRQLEKDKAHHTRRVRKRVVKEQRGEAFARGWVAAVDAQQPPSIGDESRQARIEAAIAARHGKLQTTAGREIGANTRTANSDAVAGWLAGKRARVNPGVGTSGPRLLEGGAG